MIFQTRSGSRYEIDRQNKRARRLSGVADPTARMGADGTWREYEWIRGPLVGCMCLICWATDGDTHRCTQTSPVTEVDLVAN